MRELAYEIRLRGVLPPNSVPDVDGTARLEVGSETVLVTCDIDQESLHQLVARLRDLGVELLEIRRSAAGSGELS